MIRTRTLSIFLLVATACARPAETTSVIADTTAVIETAEAIAVQEDTLAKLPDFVKDAHLPDSLQIETDKVIYGDFNGDAVGDLAAVVTNRKNGSLGVIIIHDSDKHDYFVFGAGCEVDGMTDLHWIDIFASIPKGKIVAPTLVDDETGDIIGPDESKEFPLIGDGIFMHVDESEGGGIAFGTGDKYEWYHIE